MFPSEALNASVKGMSPNMSVRFCMYITYSVLDTAWIAGLFCTSASLPISLQSLA